MFKAKRNANKSPPRSETSEGLMLAEHAHRIANDMTTLIAELETCRVRSRDAAASTVLAIAIERLHDICGVQRRLMQPQEGNVDLDVVLGELAEAVVRARSGPHRVDLELQLLPIRADSSFAWRLATILTELITNSLKHGLAGREGQISLSLRDHDDLVCCTVADDGIGAGDWRSKGSGHGHRIVQAMVDELGGTVERFTSTLGTETRLAFPRSSEAFSTISAPRSASIAGAEASIAAAACDGMTA